MFNKKFFIENFKTLFYAFIIAIIIRSLIIQPFYIPVSYTHLTLPTSVIASTHFHLVHLFLRIEFFLASQIGVT